MRDQIVTDVRVEAVLAVLAGDPAAEVASRLRVEETLVVRWTQQFIDGGRANLRGELVVDPANRDRFLALVSHELRTPLAVLTGWIGTLRSMPADSRDPEVVDTGLAAMASHARRMARLADDLLDSAAVSLGRLTLHVDDVDLGDTIIEVASSFEGDRVQVELAPDLRLRGDRTRIAQMFTNLLSDGLRRVTGEVSLTAADEYPWITARLQVPCAPPPFEEMHALFEPFDAAGNTGTGDAHTGLGLYVTRALAVAHGGQCGVEVEDDGICFWLRLPVDGQRS